VLPNHYILHKADSNGRDTKYNLINVELSVHEICGMGAPYVHVEVRRGYPSILYGIHTGNLDPHGSQTLNMSGKCVNVTI